ncbi:MAG: hypothetical protein IKU67_05690 [Firmicutes bacterium]|nr:hypothetical protein [Bacillota bacterium]
MSIFSGVKHFVKKQTMKASIILAKNAPGIEFALGVAAVLGGTIYIAASSSKASDIMDEFDRRMNEINETIKAAEETGEPEKHYPVATQNANKRLVYAHMIMSMAKLELPGVVLEMLGIGLLCKSRRGYKERIGSLSAALAAQTKMFNEYRSRVRSRLGEQEESDIFYNRHTVDYVVKETSENGVTTEVTKTKEVTEPCDMFSFLITLEDNPWGFKDPHAILTAIDDTRRRLNRNLEFKKAPFGKSAFLTMNDIAEEFCECQRPEWSTFIVYQNIKDPENAVQFDIGDADNNNVEGSARWKFINGFTDGIWVTPNIQANICDDLKTQFTISRLNEKWKGNDGKVLLQS